LEVAAAGNTIMQMIAVGDLSGIDEGKELVRNSFPCRTYFPENSEAWEE
jgi:rhamnulokinase